MRMYILLCLVTALVLSTAVYTQEKVVVVPLNTTKIQKQQTINYNVFGMQSLLSDEITWRNNGCAADISDG